MTADTKNRILNFLKDIQMRLGRMEESLTHLELRMTAQEQHLGVVLYK